MAAMSWQSASAQVFAGPSIIANVEENCDVNTQNIDFGLIDFISNLGEFKVSSYANVRCTLGTVYKLQVSTDNDKKRFMRSATTSDTIAYQFFKPNTTALLGSTGDDDFIPGTGTGVYQRVPFSVGIIPNQNIKPGIYLDVATIFISY